MLVYRRVTGLAGHTSRVSELLEQVCSCSVPQSSHLSYWPCSISKATPTAVSLQADAARQHPKIRERAVSCAKLSPDKHAWDGMQVQKLSDGDAEETTRLLYNRNVSSSKLLDDSASEPLPEPKRMAGDIISFKRSVMPLHNWMFAWNPACSLAPTSVSAMHGS